MKANNEDKLKDRYQKGETSRHEEAEFFNNQAQGGQYKPWAQYRRAQQKVMPEDLLDNIAKEIDERQPKRRNLIITIASVAASIALLAAFFINRSVNNELSYDEKAAMLEEILNTLPEEQVNNEYVLYEDAMLVIYLETK